jgi:hypothetical protein
MTARRPALMARVLVIGGLSMLALAGFIALKTPLGNGMDRLVALALTGAGILDLMVALNLSRRSR